MGKNRSVCSLLMLVAALLLLASPLAAAAAKKSNPPPAHTAAKTPAKPSAAKTDPQVKKLQQLLANTGFYPGTNSGILDTETKAAITLAQKTFKVKQTGKYDQQLVTLLTKEARKIPASYRQKLTLQATAYTSQDPGCGSLTKREHKLRKGLVAVDPRVIPLGTRLYIEGYGYAIADDIGSAIKGNKIDLAYDSRADALRFGRKPVTVLVL